MKGGLPSERAGRIPKSFRAELAEADSLRAEVVIMIVWIASYPRSGNRFFQSILQGVYGIETHKFSKLPEPADAWLAGAAAASDWRYVKTHDLPEGDNHPAVYLLRDGRDALVSYAWFVLTVPCNKPSAEVKPEEFRAALARVIETPHPRFGDWSSNALAWTRRPNTALVRYEELVQSPRQAAAKALDNLGLKLTPRADASVPTFEQMRQQHPLLVRRGKVGSWQDEFPQELLPRFWKRHGAVMGQFGYADERPGQQAA
jgi:hypothetical protein